MAERIFTVKVPFAEAKARRWVEGRGQWRLRLGNVLFNLAEIVSRCQITGLSYDERAAKTIETRFLAPSRKG